MGESDLVEVKGLGHKLAVLSNDGKHYYMPSGVSPEYDESIFILREGIFSAFSGQHYPSVYHGKQVWKRIDPEELDFDDKPTEAEEVVKEKDANGIVDKESSNSKEISSDSDMDHS